MRIDLLMLRNRVFRLGKVQKWSLPSRKVVDLLMLRNRVFRLRCAQIWVMPSWKGLISYLSVIAFSGCETFRYWQLRDTRGSIFCFLGIKFQLRNLKLWVEPRFKWVNFLILKKHVFRLRNIQVRAVPTRKDFIFLMLRNCVFTLRIVQIWVMPHCKREY